MTIEKGRIYSSDELRQVPYADRPSGVWLRARGGEHVTGIPVARPDIGDVTDDSRWVYLGYRLGRAVGRRLAEQGE